MSYYAFLSYVEWLNVSRKAVPAASLPPNLYSESKEYALKQAEAMLKAYINQVKDGTD